uniref:Uncharacterized protein n=1 Tax=Timema cristinae TaxID=61476 RepID=A0A7R9GUI8_TIMCR|nr:unnamed protein product [Timema cristinae]
MGDILILWEPSGMRQDLNKLLSPAVNDIAPVTRALSPAVNDIAPVTRALSPAVNDLAPVTQSSVVETLFFANV